MAKQSYASFYKSLSATQAKNWDKKLLKRTPAEKIAPLQAKGLEFNLAFNRWENMKKMPIPKALDQQTKAKLIQEIGSLPMALRNFFEQHVIAVYTATDIGGTAMAGSVYDDKGAAVFGFIILDINMIDRPLNQWASLKENTVFQPVKGYSLTVKLEPGQTNTRAATLRYLLTHELGHIFHAVNRLQPPYTDLTWQDDDFKAYPFNAIELARKAKLGEDYYPLYDRISFYRPIAPFDLEDAKEVYGWLDQTSFPSLYGSVNFLEDFAETFALYIHTKYLHKPHLVTLTKNGKPTYQAQNKILTPTLRSKIDLIEKSLQKYHATKSSH